MGFGTLALIIGAGLAGPLLGLDRRVLVPVVVGELAAGVAIGKTGLRWLEPEQATTAFLGSVGFCMLMFSAGMHVPIRQPGIRRGLARGAFAAVVCGLLAVPGAFAIDAVVGGHETAIEALLLASGSAAILLPSLDERQLLGDAHALTVMAQVAIADVVAIVALPLVMQPGKALHAAAGGIAVAGVAAVLLALAHWSARVPFVHRVRHASKERGWALDLRLSLLALFALAWLALRAGTSTLVAGFAVGLVVASLGGPKRLSRQVAGVAAGFFVPLFFVVLGARLDLRALFSHPAMLELAVALVVANLAVHLAGALLSRQPAAAGLAATAQLGLPAGVVELGLKQGRISPGQGGAIILSALVTIGLSSAGVAMLGATAGRGPEPQDAPAETRPAQEPRAEPPGG